MLSLLLYLWAFCEATPVIQHLDAGGEWATGLHERRFDESCHHRLLLKPRRGGPDPSRRLARRLFEDLSGLNSWHHLTRVDLDIAEIGCDTDPEELLRSLRASYPQLIDFVELDARIYEPLAFAVVDPLWATQWGHQRVGFFSAWQQLEALTVEPSEVVVALIDTGFNFQHEDIQSRVWVNAGEIPGNGVDDDGNGFVDDVNGYNFVDNNGAPWDDGGHGTHNAGIIAAQLNDLGIAGAAGRNQKVKLMIVKALTKDGGFKSDAIQALNYAMAMGAEISSNSWGGHTESQALQQAIQVAMEAGHLFVSAAGNDNANADAAPFYPCVYPHVLCVAASDDTDQFTFFSNYGLNSVELVAPGQNVLSTYLGNTEYASLTGTSFGTSMVAGAAALLFSWLRSATSTVRSVEDVRWLLLETAAELSWTQGFVGHGMLDVAAAAAKALSAATSWLVGPWSLCRQRSCSSTEGVRLRNVSCVAADGSEVAMEQCSGEPECQDIVNDWRDTYGAGCSVYASYNWCTSTGGYASGWQSTWGTFQDYAVNGQDATQVCCSCGSGRVEASGVPFNQQECPEPIGGPDANHDGLDDCVVPVATSTTWSATHTTTTRTTVTATTVTATTQTTTSFTTSTGTSSTASTLTTSTTSSTATQTATVTTLTTYSTLTWSSTTTITTSSSTLTSSSRTESSTTTSSETRTTSTSSSGTSSSSSLTSSSSSSSTSSATSSSSVSSTSTSVSTSSSTVSSTTSTTWTATSTSSSSKTSSSTSETRTTSTSSSASSTTSSTSSTTLTVRLESPIQTTQYVRSILLLVGTNETPTGIDDALGSALATSFQLRRSAVDVISVKPAVAALFRARRLEVRRAQVRSSLEPALETEFQLLLPEDSEMSVEQAMQKVNLVREDPEALLPVMGSVVETFGLATRQNVSLRFTSPEANQVQSVFVASVWGRCGGDFACSEQLIPLRYRSVWCARASDLATVEPDGLCAGARPRTSEPCPDHMERPPACGWQLSNWSSCLSEGPCTGQGVQTREAFCFSIVPDDCGEPPTTRRVCQCVIEAAVSSSTPPESAAADEASVLLLWAVLLGSLGLCCVCLCCVCRRKAKVQVEEREERTTQEERPAVADLKAECERRQISIKGCLERSDLEDLLNPPSSPASPSRVQHLAEEPQEPAAKLEHSVSELSTRPSGSPASSGERGESKESPLILPPSSKNPAPPLTELVDVPLRDGKTLSATPEAERSKSNPSSLRKTATTSSFPASPEAERSKSNPSSLRKAATSSSFPASPEAARSRSNPSSLRKMATTSGLPSPQADASRPSTSQLRKTATWTSHVASPQAKSRGVGSLGRSRTTLSHLASSDRPQTSPSRS